MAVTRAEKNTSSTRSKQALRRSRRRAILVDYRGIKVPQVTELRRQVRGAEAATYRVVKNTLAKRAVKGTPLEALTSHFEGTTAVACSDERAGRAGEGADHLRQDRAGAAIKAAVVQGRPLEAAEVTELANLPGKPELYAKLLVPAAGADACRSSACSAPRRATC